MFVRYGTDLIIFICQYLKCRPYSSRKTKHGKDTCRFHRSSGTGNVGNPLSRHFRRANVAHFRTARVASAIIIPITSAGYVPLTRSQRSQTVPLQKRRARLRRTPIRVQLRLFAAWRQRESRKSIVRRGCACGVHAAARPTAVLRKKLIKAFFSPVRNLHFLFFFSIFYPIRHPVGQRINKSKTSFDSS